MKLWVSGLLALAGAFACGGQTTKDRDSVDDMSGGGMAGTAEPSGESGGRDSGGESGTGGSPDVTTSGGQLGALGGRSNPSGGNGAFPSGGASVQAGGASPNGGASTQAGGASPNGGAPNGGHDAQGGAVEQGGAAAGETGAGGTSEEGGAAGTTSSGPAEGGTAGEAGQGLGGAVECAALSCRSCPFGHEFDSQGCETCVCSPPPLVMETDDVERASEFIEFTSTSNWAPGSGDVSVHLEWWFDEPTSESDDHFVSVQLRMNESVAFFGSERRTVWLPSSDPLIDCTAYRASFLSAQAFPLTLIDGYLTVFPSTSMTYQGGVYLIFEMEDGSRVIVGSAVDANELR